MKKALSILLAALLALSCSAFCASAAEYKLGDVDLNGQVLANDARSILRYSARLESDYDELRLTLADVNGVDGVNAADARLALRMSARLEAEVTVEFSEGPDLDDVDIPSDVDAFLDGDFSFSGVMTSGGESTPLVWSKNAKNSKFTAVQTVTGEDGVSKEISMTVHIKYKTRTSNYYYLLNDTDRTCCDFTDMLRLDTTGEMQAQLDAMNSLSFGDTGGAELTAYGSETLNDVEYESYTFSLGSAGDSLKMLTLDGALRYVYVLAPDGAADASIAMDEFTAKPGNDIFAFPPRGYKEVNVLTFAGGMGLSA